MAELSITKNESNYSIRIDGISVGGAYVGEASIVPPKEFMTNKSKVIMGFSIHPNHRKKGLGHALMNKIIEQEKKDGTDYLSLGVETRNEIAIKIYEQAGFVIDGPLYSNMHYMWKKL